MLLHDESPAAVEAREQAFLLGTYARTPFHPRSGKGARIVDADGKEYWDLLGGIAVNALGHQHPRLVKTLRDESRNLLHVSNLYFHPAQGILGERLVRASGMLRAFRFDPFNASGALSISSIVIRRSAPPQVDAGVPDSGVDAGQRGDAGMVSCSMPLAAETRRLCEGISNPCWRRIT